LIVKWNKCGKRPKIHKDKYDVGSFNGIGSIESMASDDDGSSYARSRDEKK